MNAMLSCEQCQSLLPFSVGGHLDLEEQGAVEAHLTGCDACRNEFALWHAMPSALTALQGDGRVGLNVQEAWVSLEARLPASTSIAQETVQRDGVEWPRADSPHAPTAPSAGRPFLRFPRANGFFAVVSVVLLVALSSGLFYYMRQGRSPTAANPGNAAAPVQLTYHPTHMLTPGETLPNTFLTDVQMLSPDDGWAVGGTYVIGQGVIAANTAIYHYQHGRWIASPDVVAGGVLFSVSMVSPDDGWAAGGISHVDTAGITYAAIMLHYDGQQWRQVPMPAHGQINKVKMLSATEGWAVANDFNSAFPFLHYQHGVWSDIDPTQARFYTDFSMVSPNEGWAAGYRGVIAHYLDGQWTSWPKSAPGDVTSIAMRSATDGWMVAETPENHTGKRYQQVILLRFDGTDWKATPLASATLAPLVTGIALSGDTSWLAGRIENEDASVQGSVLLQYANGKWTLERFQVDAALAAISLSSPTEGWAVGHKNLTQSFPDGSSGTISAGVLLHYLNGHWMVYQP